MPLAVENAHPLDKEMQFLEEPHVYLFRGRAIGESVTSVAHAFQKGFDAKQAIAGMKGSTRECWPRLKYVLDAARVVDVSRDVTASKGVLVVNASGMTVAVAKAHDFDDDIDGQKICDALVDMIADRPGGKEQPAKRMREDFVFHTFSRAMTDAEIVASWERNGMLARNLGTEAHLQMQYVVEGRPFRADDPEVKVGLQFLNRFPNVWRGYRCEWEIVYPEADLAGSIDLIIQNTVTKEIIIVDYKRSDKLKEKLHGYGKMLGCMKHLDECDGAAYALQLSIYQHVLESKYGFTAVDRILISLHPDKPFCTSVPFLKEEVEHIMSERIARQKALAACPYKCSVSGIPLFSPVVVLEHSDPVDKKTAMAKGWTIEDDDLVTKMVVDEWLAQNYTPPSTPHFAQSWKARMPKNGLPSEYMAQD